jgi:hypothetical protein
VSQKWTCESMNPAPMVSRSGRPPPCAPTILRALGWGGDPASAP